MLRDVRDIDVYFKGVTAKDALFLAASVSDAVKPAIMKNCRERPCLRGENSPKYNGDDDDILWFTADEASIAQTKFSEQFGAAPTHCSQSCCYGGPKWMRISHVASDQMDIEVVGEEEPEAATAAPVLPDLATHHIPNWRHQILREQPRIPGSAEFHHHNNNIWERFLRRQKTRKNKCNFQISSLK